MRERATVWIPEEVVSHRRQPDGSDTYNVTYVNGCTMSRRTDRKAAHEVPAELVQRWLDGKWFEGLRQPTHGDEDPDSRLSGGAKRGQRRSRQRQLDSGDATPSTTPSAAVNRRETKANAAKLREEKTAGKLAAAVKAARERTKHPEAGDSETRERRSQKAAARAARLSRRADAAATRDSATPPAGDAGRTVTTRSAAAHDAQHATPNRVQPTTTSARVPRPDRRHSRRNRVGDSQPHGSEASR